MSLNRFDHAPTGRLHREPRTHQFFYPRKLSRSNNKPVPLNKLMDKPLNYIIMSTNFW